MFAAAACGAPPQSPHQTQQPSPAGSAPSYSASGTEPFWSLLIAGGELRLERVGQPPLVESAPPRETVANGWRAAGQSVRVEALAAPCVNSMSGAEFADTVTVTVDGETLRGCGGEPRHPPAGP